MGYFEIILLAIIQGVTEFLPVSSSGHLVVANELMTEKVKDLVEVSIMLHFGTLLAVVVFYWKQLLELLSKDRRVLPILFVATIPAVVIGLPLKKYCSEGILENPLLAGFMFPVTALLLLWATRKPEGTRHYRDLSLAEAFKIGLLQAFALLPGVSRSGSTIVGGMSCQLDRKSAGTFAFLLAVPVIGGAGILEIKNLLQEKSSELVASGGEATSISVLLVGMLVSFLVGWVALWWLIRFVQQGRLGLFAWYLIPLGLVVITWRLAL